MSTSSAPMIRPAFRRGSAFTRPKRLLQANRCGSNMSINAAVHWPIWPLGRTPREDLRPVLADHRERAVRTLGRAGREPGALCFSKPGVLDRRQRLLTSRQSCNQMTQARLAEPDARRPAGPRELVEPDRGLFLGRPTQGAHTDDSASLAAVEARLMDFQGRFAETAPPVRVEIHPKRPRHLDGEAEYCVTRTTRSLPVTDTSPNLRA
jgi:hypothetical protein